MNFEQFKKKYQKKEVKEINRNNSFIPLVSICVQTYQQKDYITACLDSLLNQKTNFQYEILLGEDNSKDGTRDICLKYSEKFPHKIRLFLHHRENQVKVLNEPTSNFNAFYNLFSSKGKYVAFCEGDDIWTDSFRLQKQVDFLESNPDYVLVFHRYKIINFLGKEISYEEEKFQPVKDLSSKNLLRTDNHPLLLCTCFRNCIQKIPGEMIKVINVDTFMFSILGNYGKGKYLDDMNPDRYRRHHNGIWGGKNKQKKFLSKIRTYQQMAYYYSKENNSELADHFRKLAKNTLKMLTYLFLKSGKVYSAIKTVRGFNRM